ncbi:hypothetical protein BpHYR1_051703 [Brachionus plicatilis]|uniref:Uncharacterized protein n=1 Tax=Brachionus plicatilis TaxID=10195 RepID=A0A3M7SHS9_BRAPC|nr:hypothetical protein BpHYR1_051703 [Brachionus plicatilis]
MRIKATKIFLTKKCVNCQMIQFLNFESLKQIYELLAIIWLNLIIARAINHQRFDFKRTRKTI